MKKTVFFFLLAGMALSSCNKEYICTCTDFSNPSGARKITVHATNVYKAAGKCGQAAAPNETCAVPR